MGRMLSIYLNFTKFGIVVFVLFTGVIGYALSFAVESSFSTTHLLLTLFGLYFISSGSLALNQVQEVDSDSKMQRTSKRPIPAGQISKRVGFAGSVFLIGLGLTCLYGASTMSFLVGLLTILLYNGFYTMWWKRKWAFAAVPGAIPGALPVVIGYAANDPNILRADCVYGFLIMFLWQMPHFWALAVRYHEDYSKGGFPVLPAVLGVDRTIFHIGLYVFVYLFLALASPWFIPSSWLYLALVVPFSFKVIYEFFRYFESEQRWLRFFLWTNFSMIVFLSVPVAERWQLLLQTTF